jgi:hypothetical protein
MKTFFITCLLSLVAFSGYSENPTRSRAEQPHQARTPENRKVFQQKVQAHRVAFFTEKLALTPTEAEKFWSLYNTYQNQRERLIDETVRKTRKPANTGERAEFDVSHLSDAEAKQLVANKAKQIELEMKLHNDLIKLFSPQRVLIFYDTERGFQRELLKTRNRGQERGRPDAKPHPRERSKTNE